MEDCWSFLPNDSKDAELLPLCWNKSQKIRVNGQSERFWWVIFLDRFVCLLRPKTERLSFVWAGRLVCFQRATCHRAAHSLPLQPLTCASSILCASVLTTTGVLVSLPVWHCEGSASPHERLIQLGFLYGHLTGSRLLLWVHFKDDWSASACFSFSYLQVHCYTWWTVIVIHYSTFLFLGLWNSSFFEGFLLLTSVFFVGEWD